MRRALLFIAIVVLLVAMGCATPYAPTKVTSIVVTAAGGVTTVPNQTLQFYATIEPTNASNRAVTWSVTDSTGQSTTEATIDSNGILVQDGYYSDTLTVTATADDGSGVSGSTTVALDAG